MGFGSFTLPQLPSNTTPLQAPASIADAIQSAAQSGGVGNAASGAINAAKTAGQSALTSVAILNDPARLAALIIGVILIGGGILMFKGSQTIITSAARLAA